jgi:hypothetical protein
MRRFPAFAKCLVIAALAPLITTTLSLSDVELQLPPTLMHTLVLIVISMFD